MFWQLPQWTSRQRHRDVQKSHAVQSGTYLMHSVGNIFSKSFSFAYSCTFVINCTISYSLRELVHHEYVRSRYLSTSIYFSWTIKPLNKSDRVLAHVKDVQARSQTRNAAVLPNHNVEATGSMQTRKVKFCRTKEESWRAMPLFPSSGTEIGHHGLQQSSKQQKSVIHWFESTLEINWMTICPPMRASCWTSPPNHQVANTPSRYHYKFTNSVTRNSN